MRRFMPSTNDLAATGFAARPRLFVVVIALLWGATLVSAAGAVWAKHRSRELFVQLEKQNARRDNLEMEWGQLQLEQSAWSMHAFVERVAGTKLRMATPPPQDIQIVSP